MKNYRTILQGENIKLISYSTHVATWDTENQKLIRHWAGWSLTTQRHVNAFLESVEQPNIKKADWMAMPVVDTESAVA